MQAALSDEDGDGDIDVGVDVIVGSRARAGQNCPARGQIGPNATCSQPHALIRGRGPKKADELERIGFG